MRLCELLKEVSYQMITGSEDIEVTGIETDSRKVEKGQVFVCICGYQTDGHEYLREAIHRGAVAAVVQREGLHSEEALQALVKVEDTRKVLSYMAASWYGYPAKHLKMIGITGTKGKTTTAYMIQAGLKAAGYKVGMIGTIEIDTVKRVYHSQNTTPDALEIQKLFKEMADEGCDMIVMEVSSQALKLHRVEGVQFEIAVFTNLGKDHIGTTEHADMEEYLQCKRQLFLQCNLGIGYGEDPAIEKLWKNTSCEKRWYGSAKGDSHFDYMVDHVEIDSGANILSIHGQASGRANGILQLSIPGFYNILNGLAAVSVLCELKIPEELIFQTLKNVCIPGRMEMAAVWNKGKIVVDYAHNAMSLEHALKTLRAYTEGRLLLVFGCGGNRSRERRKTMGRVAGQYADWTILTSDNPRYENPKRILSEIENGILELSNEYQIIEDRREAIKAGILQMQCGDILLIAGKGHETYQEIEGVRYPMDDREWVRQCTQTLL